MSASPSAAARQVRRELVQLARPAGTFDASRYFRGSGTLGFHNVKMPKVRELAKAVVAEHPTWTVRDAMTCADALMRDRFLEVKAVAIEIVARYRKSFTPALLPAWKRWLARGDSANWATTDAMCGLLIGPLLLMHPRLVPVVARWSAHSSLWVRRASIVSLIPLARRGLYLDTAYAVARRLHPDEHDLIHKAVGWTLREAGKADAGRLERYLIANGPRIPRTSLRYAIERFPVSKRRVLLAVTRTAATRRE